MGTLAPIESINPCVHNIDLLELYHTYIFTFDKVLFEIGLIFSNYVLFEANEEILVVILVFFQILLQESEYLLGKHFLSVLGEHDVDEVFDQGLAIVLAVLLL